MTNHMFVYVALIVFFSMIPQANGETSGTITIVSAKTTVELSVKVANAPEEWHENLAPVAGLKTSSARVYLFPRDTVFPFNAGEATKSLDVIGVDSTGHVVWLYEKVGGDRCRASHIPVIAIVAAPTGIIQRLGAKNGNLVVASGFALRPMDKPGDKPDGLDRTIEALTAAKDKYPDDVEVYLELAAFLEGVDQREKARELITRSLAITPTATAHITLGKMAHARGETEAAIEHLEKAIAIDSASLPAYRYLGTLLQINDSLERALELLTHAIEKNPEVVDFSLSLARVQIAMGEFDKAEKTLAPALGDDSTRPDAQRVMGDVHLRRGNMSEAAKAYMEYLKTYPSAPHAADLRAFVLVHRDAEQDKGDQP